jgi:Ni/Fe-hydrogenase subunit HybB-like protein
MNHTTALPSRSLRLGFWQGVFALLMVLFAVATVMRFTQGLGATTNLSDTFPWGLWIGLDLLCGVGLAAGAFTLTAVVHLFNIRRFAPIVRPTVLTGFLGYVFVIIALLFDVGQPWRIWHPMLWWNPHSVMFEVAWCVMLYTTVLALEFSPMVFERLKLERPQRVIHAVTTPLVIAGVLLSTLHQSSLGTLYLIVPSKLHPFWYTSLLPFLFYLSAIGAGIGMVIVESYLSRRGFGHVLHMDLLEPLGRAMAVVVGLYAVIRIQVLVRNGVLGELLHPGYEAWMLMLELGIGVLVPIVLLASSRVRNSERGLVVAAFLVVLGFVMNRLNVSVTGMEGAAGARYFPSWMELVVSVGLVALLFAVFALAVRYLPVFPAAHAAPAGRTRERWGDPAAG